MPLEEIKARYCRAVEEAYYKGNLDPINELYDSDVIIHQPPFPDIEGLEAYKQNMFALLGKPGFEEKAAELMDASQGNSDGKIV